MKTRKQTGLWSALSATVLIMIIFAPHGVSAGEAVDVPALTSQINSGDANQQAAAVKLIKEKLNSSTDAMVSALQKSLLPTMLKANMNDDAAALALDATIVSAKSSITAEALMVLRVRALLAGGKGQEALSAAKSLYNVSSMSGTSLATDLFAQALSQVHPQDSNLHSKFRAQQVLGMSADAGDKPQICTVIREVKADSAAFLAASAKVVPDEYYAQVKQGNLMLLADNLDAARTAFEAAYTVADNRMLPAATENLARCIKAEDGTVGRANSLVMSVRAPSQPSVK